jgi:site-specific DNA recombinase
MSAESVKRRATCPDTQFGHAMAITLQDSLARMRWNDPSLWIWSPEPTHEPLVSKDDWTRAQSVVAAVKQRAPKPTSRPYLLRGRVFCASCGRRMHGQTRGGARRYYRCAAHARYPGITDAHPRDVLVREQPIIDALEEWLDELFAPEHATQTARQIAAALAHGPDRTEHIDAARRRIVTAKREVERCRAALRDTNSPAARREVLTWLDEAAGEKEQAELALTAAMQLAPPSLSIEEIVAVVEHCDGLTGIIRQSTHEERASLYEAIGVSAVYNPQRNQVRLGADPVASTACRRGDLNPHALAGTRPSTSPTSPVSRALGPAHARWCRSRARQVLRRPAPCA